MSHICRPLLVAATCAMLAACGGSEFDSQSAATAASPAVLAPPPGIDLGSAMGSPVATSNTCWLTNQSVPACGGGGTAPDQTYYWTAPYTGRFDLTTFGSNYDSVLHIYDANTGAPLGCNDDAGGTVQSALSLILNAGDRLRIVVDGYGSICGSASLNIGGAPALWTQWYDRDDPSGTGDWEGRVDQVPVVCAAPISVQCQTVGGVDWTLTGEVVACNTNGFVCVNANQPDGICLDYRVRFLCLQ